MKTRFIILALFAALSWTSVSAQQYRTAAGLFIDVGDGSTLVGPTIKHFFNPTNAIAGSVLFGNNFTMLSAEWSHNQPLAGANGLSWHIGVGPQLGLSSGHTSLYIRPATGLEFKIPTAPLALGFDWRPLWYVGDR